MKWLQEKLLPWQSYGENNMEHLTFSFLQKSEYDGYRLDFSYTTDRCYDVIASPWGMRLEETMLPHPVEKRFEDHLFAQWLEDPVALGAFRDGELVGVIEGSLETWHDVFRISNLLVQESCRGCGIGGELMRRMLEHAREIPNCRGVILETQSCNYPAICFYRSHGFSLSRIDLREYSNEDIQRKEVRLDFFLPFDRR